MLDLTPLNDALHSLQNAVAVIRDETGISNTPTNVREVIEAGVIQNFKVTYQLCWKFTVRWISLQVSPEETSPRTKRDIFKTAARYGLIEDPKRWFRYTEARNVTSHAYDRKKAEIVLKIAPEFFIDAEQFYAELERVNV